MLSLDPTNKDFLDTLSFLLKVIGGVGAFYLFITGFLKYKKEQTWKRSEFVAKEIKEFTADKMVRNAMYMLDWGRRSIELFPDENECKNRYAIVDRKILKLALQNHKFKFSQDGKDRFTKTEIAIRDNFDQFLLHLERFDQFIGAGLIETEELKPYLQYWIDTITRDMEEDVRNIFFHYIESYGFVGVQKLFQKFGEDILPKTPLESTEVFIDYI